MKPIKQHHERRRSLVMLVLCTVASTAPAYPPDPDNAALLYYQAFIVRPKNHDEVVNQLDDVARGKMEPTTEIRQYLEKCQGSIELTVAAASIPECTWGIRYSQGFEAQMPHLAQMRSLAQLMAADARVRALDGDASAALDRCLVMRQMAQHIGDDTVISLLVGISVNTMANQGIRDTLAEVQVGEDTLARLAQQLSIVPSRQTQAKSALKNEAEIALAQMHLGNDQLIQLMISSSEDLEEEKAQRLRNADDSFFEQNRRYYAEVMAAVNAVLDRTESYEQKHMGLSTLIQKVFSDAPQEDAAVFTALLIPALGKILSAETAARADDNALRAGVALCLAKERGGSLPAALPAGSPKDPFTGKDFAYETTDSGFVLRCQAQDLDKGKIHAYEFTVH